MLTVTDNLAFEAVIDLTEEVLGMIRDNSFAEEPSGRQVLGKFKKEWNNLLG